MGEKAPFSRSQKPHSVLFHPRTEKHLEIAKNTDQIKTRAHKDKQRREIKGKRKIKHTEIGNPPKIRPTRRQ